MPLLKNGVRLIKTGALGFENSTFAASDLPGKKDDPAPATSA
jgi:hypothetical protein